MANLTLKVDDDLLKRARIKALEEGTSVNAVVRSHLERYAGESEARAAARELLRLSDEFQGGSGPEGRGWTRDDIYAERISGIGRGGGAR